MSCMLFSYLRKNIKNFFFYFCITSWPFLNFYASPTNQRQIDIKNFLILFFVFLFLSFSICETIKFFLKKSHERIVVAYSVFIIWFFSYGNFIEFIHDKIGVLHAYPYAIATLFGEIFIVFKLSKYSYVQKSSKLFILLLFSFSLLENIYIYLISERDIIQKNRKQSYNFKKNMNVYFLLLDAYPRADILNKNLNYNNNLFIDFLNNRGFIVARESYSNYPSTTSSLSSVFQMSYLETGDINTKDILSPDKIAFSILRSNDYTFITLPSHHDYLGAKNSADIIISPSSSFLFSVTNIHFLSTSALRPFIKFLRPYLYFGKNEVLKLEKLKDRKKFVFMHFLHLHDFVYDEDCKINCKARIPEDTAPNFIQNIKCLNIFVQEIVSNILKNDPESIIIIQSDHGPWFWRKENGESLTSCEEFQRWYANFSAIYLPDWNKSWHIRDYLINSPTPVNTLKIVFSYLSDSELELWPDYNYLGHQNITYLHH